MSERKGRQGEQESVTGIQMGVYVADCAHDGCDFHAEDATQTRLRAEMNIHRKYFGHGRFNVVRLGTYDTGAA